jgi:hypothetical protein
VQALPGVATACGGQGKKRGFILPKLEIHVEAEIRNKALRATQRMLNFAKALKKPVPVLDDA